jgi:SAM-dependent methyltransferase
MRAHPESSAAERRDAVRAFWEREACGEAYAIGPNLQAQLETQARQRYALEPYLRPFARFEAARGLDVLEIGLGLGADHLEFARARPRTLAGVDVTSRAAGLTASRLRLAGLTPRTMVADAERLPFRDSSFDLVYSWGVLHHAADPPATIGELHRVLRPGGRARVMLYHRRSLVGFMLWARYALLRGRPWTDMQTVFDRHMESPGTRAFTVSEAQALFAKFDPVTVNVQLTFADLLEGVAGQRHRGAILSAARAFWPRWLVRRAGGGLGLDLLIEATRPA